MSLTAIAMPTSPASIQDNEPIQDDSPELDPSIHESHTLAEKIYKDK
jgi:hypothetical protein